MKKLPNVLINLSENKITYIKNSEESFDFSVIKTIISANEQINKNIYDTEDYETENRYMKYIEPIIYTLESEHGFLYYNVALINKRFLVFSHHGYPAIIVLSMSNKKINLIYPTSAFYLIIFISDEDYARLEKIVEEWRGESAFVTVRGLRDIMMADDFMFINHNDILSGNFAI